MKILNNSKNEKIEQLETLINEIKTETNTATLENISAEGLESLIGQTVVFFCAVYIYVGKLIGINTTCVKLENTHIIYETGAFTDKNWKDAQKFPTKYHYIQTNLIESFGVIK